MTLLTDRRLPHMTRESSQLSCCVACGLTSLSHLLSRRRISVFGHVARLDDVTPANMALQLHVNVSLNRPPDRT